METSFSSLNNNRTNGVFAMRAKSDQSVGPMLKSVMGDRRQPIIKRSPFWFESIFLVFKPRSGPKTRTVVVLYIFGIYELLGWFGLGARQV